MHRVALQAGRTYGLVATLVLAFALTAYGSYELGARHAYGGLSVPPESVQHASSSGLPELVFTEKNRSIEFREFWIT